MNRRKIKSTFQCTLGHPVDFSTCWGSEQQVQPREQQRYEQQHGVRTSDVLRDVKTNRPAGEHVGKPEEDAEVLEMRPAFCGGLTLSGGSPPVSLGSLPHCGAGHLSANT